ncbi:SDR family oxidoreductase [Rhizobium sp. LjRoot98]|uniref:dTDP-4-dehydrorhamnose reductase family protein n=1 Tax=Rhizobium sp. LjRoot98 TaxID=3342345 RepID=UPI003ECCA938
MKILVLGVSGMLGSAVFRLLSHDPSHVVWGAERGDLAQRILKGVDTQRILSGLDVNDWDSVVGYVNKTDPDVIINCVGVVKQLADAQDPLVIIPINTLLPHRLHALCIDRGCRLVHVSTDCVFAGVTGNYSENAVADARDLYGLSKYLGEIKTPGAITLRTSIIGHELASSHSLVNWFLSQRGKVRGFSRAIFSGLPTVELATVIKNVVIPRSDLYGLYHISANPINKYDLLYLIKQIYNKEIDIERDENLVIDRSLDSSRFRAATGYVAPDWQELIVRMHQFENSGV